MKLPNLARTQPFPIAPFFFFSDGSYNHFVLRGGNSFVLDNSGLCGE
jgi:hypothetical protein